MDNPESPTSGFVYILEVKDIQLPVCKIGMTTRTPTQRCTEINNSSTGDFLWEVAHSVKVDNCRKLESLVHSKLLPLRQKGREFFNLNPDDANVAMMSILENQNNIKKIDTGAISGDIELPFTQAPRKEHAGYRKVDSEYADLLQLFSSVLQVKGRPFGQLNKPSFGISDGKQGVQWNLAVTPDSGEVKLGVNLEGSEKTGNWLISPFILTRPDIEILKARVEDTDNAFLSFYRDAWQGASRLDIVEKYLGGKQFSLSELDATLWEKILVEALTCLDENRSYRKRKTNQTVTLKSNGQKLEREISPHLTIWTFVNMDGDLENEIKMKIAQMTPIHDWVTSACHSGKTEQV